MRPCLLTALLLTACGGAPHPQTSAVTPPTTAGAAPAGCPADQAPIAGGCFSVAGTRWWFVSVLPDGGQREFVLVLHTDGRAEVGDEADQTPDNDEWVQRGATVTVYMNDRYVAYTATVYDDRELRGQGLNVRQQKWDFAATRMP